VAAYFRFSDAGIDERATRSCSRRPKSAKARNRGRQCTGGAAGAMGIWPRGETGGGWSGGGAAIGLPQNIGGHAGVKWRAARCAPRSAEHPVAKAPSMRSNLISGRDSERNRKGHPKALGARCGTEDTTQVRVEHKCVTAKGRATLMNRLADTSGRDLIRYSRQGGRDGRPDPFGAGRFRMVFRDARQKERASRFPRCRASNLFLR
jgi:hypothetical protein